MYYVYNTNNGFIRLIMLQHGLWLVVALTHVRGQALWKRVENKHHSGVGLRVVSWRCAFLTCKLLHRYTRYEWFLVSVADSRQRSNPISNPVRRLHSDKNRTDNRAQTNIFDWKPIMGSRRVDAQNVRNIFFRNTRVFVKNVCYMIWHTEIAVTTISLS